MNLRKWVSGILALGVIVALSPLDALAWRAQPGGARQHQRSFVPPRGHAYGYHGQRPPRYQHHRPQFNRQHAYQRYNRGNHRGYQNNRHHWAGQRYNRGNHSGYQNNRHHWAGQRNYRQHHYGRTGSAESPNSGYSGRQNYRSGYNTYSGGNQPYSRHGSQGYQGYQGGTGSTTSSSTTTTTVTPQVPSDMASGG